MPRLARVVASAVVALALTADLRAADWPQWLGPKRDGSTPETIAPWKEKLDLKAAWRWPVGEAFSSPVVAGGRVFLHTRSTDKSKEAETVLAYDAVSGVLRWSDTYDRPRYRSVLGSGPRATPTVAGKKLFTLGINGVLSCYETESGTRKWQVDLYERFKAELPGFAVCGSPLVVGNRVIVSVGGKGTCVVALHVDTGETQWQALDDPAGTASPVLFAGGGRPKGAAPDVVIVTPLRILAIDPLDGALRWEHPMVFQPQGTSPTPIALGDVMVAGTQAHGAVAVQVSRKDDVPGAERLWRNAAAKSYFSSGVAGDELVFLITNTVDGLPSASLQCHDPKTGSLLWTRADLGYFHAGVIRLGDGKLLVLGDSGKLTLLSVDAKGSKVLCQAKACGGTLTNPAFSDGRLFVRDDRELICIPLASSTADESPKSDSPKVESPKAEKP